jgi:hypothetical protein
MTARPPFSKNSPRFVVIAAVVGGAVLAAWPAAVMAAASQPVMGTAANYAVIAGSAITTVPPTQINGSLALSPGSSETGGPTVSGASDVDNSAAVTAQNDLTTAYNDTADATPFDNLTASGSSTNLAGLTLSPGIYRITNTALLDGTLTLAGDGSTNPTFIFQMEADFTTGPGATVALTNGASGCAVFWQVTSLATLGSTTQFQGNLLAQSGVTMGTDSTIGQPSSATAGGSPGGRALVSRSGPLTTAGGNVITAPVGGCVFAAATTPTPTTGVFGSTPNGLPWALVALACLVAGVLVISTGLRMRRQRV